MKVWIGQDLGSRVREGIAPDVSFGPDDGLYHVEESAENFGAEKMLAGTATQPDQTVLPASPTAPWNGSSNRQRSDQANAPSSTSNYT